MSTATNGAHPALDLDDHLAAVTAELEGLLVPLGAEQLELEERLAEVKARAFKIESALAALTGPALVPVEPKKPKSREGKPSNYWTPSEPTLAKVAEALKAAGEAQTVAQLSDATEVSRGTVEKALRELRTREQVRLAGVASTPGSPKLFALMP